jgi:hypothetical protein
LRLIHYEVVVGITGGACWRFEVQTFLSEQFFSMGSLSRRQ